MLQTSGEVFVPLFWGVGTLIVMKIYSGTTRYFFNDMEYDDDILENYVFPLDWWCWGP